MPPMMRGLSSLIVLSAQKQSNMSSYPEEYWQGAVARYTTKDWSRSISPFAQEFASHIPAKSELLELGTGAGQDGLGLAELGHHVLLSDGVDTQLAAIEQTAKEKGLHVHVEHFNLLDTFPFEDVEFDAIYAQLVLHYFDDEEMSMIISEIYRVLKPGGYLGILVNTQDDPEYAENPAIGDEGMRTVDGITKRFFTPPLLNRFLHGFEPIVLDNKGRTPKDDASGITTLIRFIGRKEF